MPGKWRAHRKGGFAIGAACFCLLLILAAKAWYSVSIRDGQARVSTDREEAGKIDDAFGNGAPFIRYSSKNESFAVGNLRWQPQLSAADYSANGLAGPFSILKHAQIGELLLKIARDWEELRPRLGEQMIRAGFEGPSDRACFLWLEDCFKLGRDKSIVEAVEAILGHPVLLFGLTVWNAPPKSQQALKLKFEGFQCETVDVLLNSGARLVQNSHTMTRKMAIKLANQIKAARRFYGGESPQLRQQLESVVLMYLADKVEGAAVQDIDLEPGGAYFINGRLLYGTSNPTEALQASLLLQFVPANCTLRDQEVDSSHIALVSRPVLPSTLLASETSTSGDNLTSDGRNDVRHGLVHSERLSFEEEDLFERREYRPPGILPGSNITVLRRRARATGASGVYEFARSPLLDWITVEMLAFKGTEAAFKSSAHDQVVVVVRGTLNYHHVGSRRAYREVKELRSGELAFLSSSELHALTSGAGVDYIRISWAGKQGSTLLSSGVGKSINNGKQVFAMPVSGLGAINARSVVLRTGQAYDPENEADCDVLVVVLKGAHLQIVPSQEYLQVNEAVLIPAGEACILWNSGLFPVTIIALQLYASLKFDDKDSCYLEAAYRTRGKVM
ncbi:uncharacterized protein LOC9644925 [Selaginella moellendorffii]|uniref:uncharacterized protein LOC9644925 n=1 Tax=Selaginella moellendorffii TaxID=88036 RepID=UPI000D1CFC98|nr:uncharacterized protein LOC9644925 [Selaginella moellendorffii]|eukprot:XP_024544982.1 uncharacterized protein LOC9644925 [Selaginella moellendorffii]